MDKKEAFTYLVNNISEKDGKFLFVNHTPVALLKQIIVGLGVDDRIKLAKILGSTLYVAILEEIKRDPGSITTLGFSMAVGNILDAVENMRAEGVITFEYNFDPEKALQETTNDLQRVTEWLRNNNV
jgi:hypothetical protein